MIGVVAGSEDLEMAEEFFELFKTPWEPGVPGRSYRTVLSASAPIEGFQADLFIVYGSAEHTVDRVVGAVVEATDEPIDVEMAGDTLPVYGRLRTFDRRDAGGDRTAWRGQPIETSYQCGSRRVARIGYDLFSEVRRLLTSGQPVSRAAVPALDIHIALLRRTLIEAGIPFVEIPPRPHGHGFVCCLTHDIDFCGIRRHAIDRTLAGFVLRASAGTAVEVLRRRRPAADARRNWGALASLPFVFAGIRRDPWCPFDDYRLADRGHRSTFFVVPAKDHPGVSPDGRVDARRAVRYQASEVRDELRAAQDAGSELGVHGLDAWRDAHAGREEIGQVMDAAGCRTAGVRMHWLYFDADSPRRLEEAGFEYDSTWGYNDAVGYRAGTSQAFRPPGTRHLMELPLSIMDTAMFYPDRMGLPHDEGLRRCWQIVAHARRAGGTVVVNWHDRSLAPERLWHRPYRALLDELERGDGQDGAWFATAGQAVDWFRWRRSIRFARDRSGSEVSVAVPPRPAGIPAARMWTHRTPVGSAGRPDERRIDGQSLRVEL